MRKTPLALWLFFPLVLFALVSSAQTLPLNLEMEVGYRWTSVDGNDDLYRSQVNVPRCQLRVVRRQGPRPVTRLR